MPPPAGPGLQHRVPIRLVSSNCAGGRHFLLLRPSVCILVLVVMVHSSLPRSPAIGLCSHRGCSQGLAGGQVNTHIF